MYRCIGCNVVFENNVGFCTACGNILQQVSNNTSAGGSSRVVNEPDSFTRNTMVEVQVNNDYMFERNEGFITQFDGTVAEVNTQQFYQSKLTKILRAVFAGEPYQLSHTSFVTVFRLEEHVLRGYPERAQDITLYGNMRGVFAVGDDVTVRAKRSGDKCLARHIYNHATNSNVSIQANIPALVIRTLSLILGVVLFVLINEILKADYAAIGADITAMFTPIIVVGAIVWYIFKSFRKQA
jgi:hypothetical protein